MWHMLWPVLIVVCANTIYHTCAKFTPHQINPFASLSVTYLIALVLSLLLFYCSSSEKSILQEAGKANWASYILGASIVFLEFGFLCVYRAGWPTSSASLVCNMIVSCLLLVIGVLAYKEVISPKQMAGIAACIAGLFLINQK